MNVDMVFASFIRDAQGVKDVRKVLGKAGEKILIISKIENLQGKTYLRLTPKNILIAETYLARKYKNSSKLVKVETIISSALFWTIIF